jgi:acetyl esterase/lipase
MAEADIRTIFSAYDSVHKHRHPPAGVLAEYDISYGGHERHKLDFYSPAASSRSPLVIFVHGGGFVSGGRRLAPDSAFYGNIGWWLASAGFACAAISYRLAPEFKWPAGSDDLASALDAVVSGILGRETARHNIILFGHSAGSVHVAGYISRAAAGGMRRPCRAAILLSGLYDLELVEGPTASIANYFGQNRSDWPERSSADGLLKSEVPLFIGYAEHDPRDFQTQAAGMLARSSRFGRIAQGAMFANHTHISEIASVGTEDVTVTSKLLPFLRKFGAWV